MVVRCIILTTPADKFHGLICFNHIMYMLQTCMHQSIAKLFTHPCITTTTWVKFFSVIWLTQQANKNSCIPGNIIWNFLVTCSHSVPHGYHWRISQMSGLSNVLILHYKFWFSKGLRNKNPNSRRENAQVFMMASSDILFSSFFYFPKDLCS